jgi:uncharacterized SAM-binding protein YcdF (DUF218 family)
VKRNRAIRTSIAIVILLLIGVLCAVRSGSYLVVNQPERSDVIVVLAGDHDDHRYWGALALLRAGYGQKMVMDASSDLTYGQTSAERAAAFVRQSAGSNQSQISVCTITNDSTVQEASNIRDCLAQLHPAPKSALLVTSDFHTRRAFSIVRSRLPQYRWSVAAVNDPTIFGQPWWRNREWAKTALYEWQKLVWWQCFESWRKRI